MRLAASVLLILSFGGAAEAQRPTPPPPNPLSQVDTFKCTFPTFVATEWVNGERVTREGQDEDFSFYVTEINTRRSSAIIVGRGGGVPASAMLGDTSLNVVEQTRLGNFILTSIFRMGGEGTTYLATHSRHLGDLQTPPSVSQHFGTCTPAEAGAAASSGR